jgi:hypothetical protein
MIRASKTKRSNDALPAERRNIEVAHIRCSGGHSSENVSLDLTANSRFDSKLSIDHNIYACIEVVTPSRGQPGRRFEKDKLRHFVEHSIR